MSKTFLKCEFKNQIIYFMKFLCFFCLNFFLISNSCVAETLLSKSDILRNANKCFQDSQNQECRKLILKMEQRQLFEFEQNRFKCQASILGLQTELVEAYFFEKIPKNGDGIMIPYVVKNC